MSKWHIRYSFPVTFPKGPIDWLDPAFDNLFIRTNVYDELDRYLNNIDTQVGQFWVSGPLGGYGKSTMLHYVARKLYSAMHKLKAFPFHISVGKKSPTVEGTFYREFLNEFLAIPKSTSKAHKVLNTTLWPEIKSRVLEWFGPDEHIIRRIGKELVDANVGELERRFRIVLEKVLRSWTLNGVFSKYVLLIDEMDKLHTDDVLAFLGENQDLFQDLYQEYDFVAFVSGHRSWVERIRDGTEYTFFRGTVFDIPPFRNISDIGRLVETRLVQHLHLFPSDNPWTPEGYQELEELSGGVPRLIIELAEIATNEAQRQDLDSIGPGILKEIIVTEKNLKPIEDYLQNHPETYIKLRSAVDRHADALLYIFYDTPGHRILREYDKNLTSRARYLGTELADQEWIEKINVLVNLECISETPITRDLSKDISELFDKLSKHPALIQKVVPAALKKLAEAGIRFKEGAVAPPDCQKIIATCFNVNKGSWMVKEDVFNWFLNSTAFQLYVHACKTEDPVKSGKGMFEKEFSKYIARTASSLMAFEEGDRVYYRRLPEGMTEDHYETLTIFESRAFLDSYIELVASPLAYDITMIRKLDGLIKDILCAVAEAKNVEFQIDGLRTKGKERTRLFKELEITPELRRRLDFYTAESKKEPINKDIIKEISRQVILGLAEEYQNARERSRPRLIGIRELLDQGENEKVEFKSSMCWDYEKKERSSIVEHAIAKTVSCFMNSEGGYLLIGVGDNKQILGLDADFAVIKKPNIDGFEQHFTGLVNKFLGKEHRQYTKIYFDTLDGKTIAAVRVNKSRHAAFVKFEGKEEFYVRLGSTCQPLSMIETGKYIEEHFKD